MTRHDRWRDSFCTHLCFQAASARYAADVMRVPTTIPSGRDGNAAVHQRISNWSRLTSGSWE
jgi:hypothetical protein